MAYCKTSHTQSVFSYVRPTHRQTLADGRKISRGQVAVTVDNKILVLEEDIFDTLFRDVTQDYLKKEEDDGDNES